MKNQQYIKSNLIFLLFGSLLAVIVFVVTYLINPLKLGEHFPVAAIPAFLLSVIVLIINHMIAIYREVQKVSVDSNRIHEAVRNYLHVTKIGTPKKAWEYIIHRLPVLEYVQNTSFNFREDQVEQSNERLYDASTYHQSLSKIARQIEQGLVWKDIGDSTAMERFQRLNSQINGNKCLGRYEFKFIGRAEPQINFILLTYKDGTTEVLFNWDFRDIPQDPVVLLSRDHEIFNMFAVQHKGLSQAAVHNYDSIATRSTPKK